MTFFPKKKFRWIKPENLGQNLIIISKVIVPTDHKLHTNAFTKIGFFSYSERVKTWKFDENRRNQILHKA